MTKSTSIHQLDGWLYLETCFPSVNLTDRSLTIGKVREAIDQKTKPPGSLGQLERVAAQIALLTDSLTPKVDPARVIVFGGDHGVTCEGVSAYPAEVTQQMMVNFAEGGAAVCVLGAANSVQVEVIDVGVNADISSLDGVVHAKVASGTDNFVQGSAMTIEQRDKAMTVGRDSISRAVKDGVCCLGLGEMGIGNTTAAACIAALLLDLPAAQLTGRGTGVDDAALAHKTSVVQRAIELHRPQVSDPLSILQHVGGFEIAAIVGAIDEASRVGLPVLIDGFISTAAALVACRHDEITRRVMFFSHHSAEAGHSALLLALNAEPLLVLDLRLGEGSGTALAHPLLRAAAAMLSNMSTFADAGVSGRSGA